MLSRLKVRTKLIAILLPLLVGLGVLAGLGVMDRLDERGDAQRSQTLVATARASAGLVHQLQIERLLSVALQNGEASAGNRLGEQKSSTNKAATELSDRARELADVEGSVGDERALQFATRVDQQVDAIAKARGVYKPDGGSPAAVSDAYSSIISGLNEGATKLMAAAGVAGGGTDGGRSIHWLSSVKEADARSGTDVLTVVAATRAGSLADAAWAVEEIRDLRADAQMAMTVFTTDTDVAGRKRLDGVLKDEGFVASQALYNVLGALDPAVGMDLDTTGWIDTTIDRLDALRDAESGLFGREFKVAQGRSEALEREVRLYLGGTATALLLALLLAASVTRSITSSLGRLTHAARTISNDQLPKLVESLRNPAVEQDLALTEIDLNSQDEFAELAAAFNAVEQTALDVAAEQVATLRKGISEIFVNLARRNQSLLDRQIEFIDRLEANEEDPDQLENLFKLDHLATRMRRNAESLLVLAGAEAPRRRSRAVSFTDVIRVAVGEVEDFARITLLAVDEANAVGSAAVDIAHLLSELMENGTQYSPPERSVEVVGHRTNDGGYVVSITDQGMGMTPEAMIEANRQLARPPVVGLSMSRSLGFVVVATLAHRHGIEVRLTDSPAGGVTALVALPPSLLVADQDATVPAVAAPAADVGGPADLPEWALAPQRGGSADSEPAPAFQLEGDFDWAPDPPTFADPGVPGPAEWEEPATFGVSEGLDPTVGLVPPAIFTPSAQESPFAETSPEATVGDPTALVPHEAPVEGPSSSEQMGTAFEQGLFALLDNPDLPDAPDALPALLEPVREMAFPPAPPLPSTPPELPQRARQEPVVTADPAGERIGSPSRPPEEIRNILSRYRDGLHSGRAVASTAGTPDTTSTPADAVDEQPGGPVR